MKENVPVKYVSKETFGKMLDEGHEYEHFLGVQYIETDKVIYIKSPQFIKRKNK